MNPSGGGGSSSSIRQGWNIRSRTTSPGSTPIWPPGRHGSQDTPSTTPPEGRGVSDIGVALRAIDRTWPSGVDEHHVERDEGVLHPERHRLRRLEIEKHAAIISQVLAEHESLLPRRRGVGDLDDEMPNALLSHYIERLGFQCGLFGERRGRGKEGQQRKGQRETAEVSAGSEDQGHGLQRALNKPSKPDPVRSPRQPIPWVPQPAGP